MKSKKSILLVDDDERVLKGLSGYLALKGYTTETAKTGREALEKSRSHFFNLAVLDIRLPDMDGTELLTKMIETEPKMKKIMLTGYPNLESAIESVNKKADMYLVKPVEPKKLLAIVQEKLREQDEESKMGRNKLVKYIETRDKEADEG